MQAGTFDRYNQEDQILLLESMLTADDYDELGTFLQQAFPGVNINNITTAYQTPYFMKAQLLLYAATEEGQAKIRELFGPITPVITNQVDSKLNENLNILWNNNNVAGRIKKNKNKKRTLQSIKKNKKRSRRSRRSKRSKKSRKIY